MPIFDRDEIEREFDRYKQVVLEAAVTGNFEDYYNLYTEDATLRAPGVFRISGRKALKRFYEAEFLTREPMRHLVYYPVEWYMIDEHTGSVCAEFQCRMDDPGDGSIHEFQCFSLLKYAGHGLWNYDRDIFDPADMDAVFESWTEAKKRCEAAE